LSNIWLRRSGSARKTAQNPPYAADAPILARLARIGLVPGQDFDSSKLASVPNLQDVPKVGVERIMAHYPASGADLNGWVFFKPGGRYGTDYVQRALITRLGLGCNLTEDAVYPGAKTDSTGQKLDGANKYVIRFPKGQMPPVRGFWSLTMYDAQYFFVANPLNRYTLSQRNALKDTDNPVTRRITLPLRYQADFNDGAYKATKDTFEIDQGVVPFRLSEDWALITRTKLPVEALPPKKLGDHWAFGFPNG
jgi:hypothetical protein